MDVGGRKLKFFWMSMLGQMKEENYCLPTHSAISSPTPVLVLNRTPSASLIYSFNFSAYEWTFMGIVLCCQIPCFLLKRRQPQHMWGGYRSIEGLELGFMFLWACLPLGYTRSVYPLSSIITPFSSPCAPLENTPAVNKDWTHETEPCFHWYFCSLLPLLWNMKLYWNS